MSGLKDSNVTIEGLEVVNDFVLFSIGQTKVTLGSVIAAIAVAAVAFLLAKVIGDVLRRARGRVRQGASSIYIVEKLVVYGLVIVGLVSAVTMLGINLTSLAVFAGALGVGVGLGLQGVVKEFVSGLVLVFEGSVQVGDYIELQGGGRGEVKEVGTRATRFRNNDNVDILVPNSRLIEERVTIWSHKGAIRRMHIPFQVAYGTDKALVREAGLKAASRVPFTLPDEGDRKAQVWLVGFGEHSLKFELLVWPELSAVKRPAAAHAAYTWALEEALCEYGIEIPFPQVDVRMRRAFGREGDEALKALGLKGGRAAEPAASTVTPSKNDAIADLEAAKVHDLEQEAEEGQLEAAPAEPKV